MAEEQSQQSFQAAVNSAGLHPLNRQAPAQLPPFSQQHHPSPEGRQHYPMDAGSHTRRYSLHTAPAMDYDRTEGLGGVSVSSYDSMEDDRVPVDPSLRNYPPRYHHGNENPPANYPLAADHHQTMLPQYSNPPVYPPVSYPVDEVNHHAPGHYTPSSEISSSISPPNGRVGSTKYSTAPSGQQIARALSAEEQARLAAEEDKRRRNTAASARFRAKKKQREQQLERTVRETTELNATLEARVSQLEMENRWLKNLLTEKNENVASRILKLQQQQNSADQGTQSEPVRQRRDVGVGTDD